VKWVLSFSLFSSENDGTFSAFFPKISKRVSYAENIVPLTSSPTSKDVFRFKMNLMILKVHFSDG
jgi:hypothetical protein